MKLVFAFILSQLFMNIASANDFSQMVWPKAKAENQAHLFSHFEPVGEQLKCEFPKVAGKDHAFFHKHLGFFNVCRFNNGRSVMLQFKNSYSGEICFYPSIKTPKGLRTFKQKTCLKNVEEGKLYKLAFEPIIKGHRLLGLMMMRNQSHYFAPPFDSTLKTVEAFSQCLNGKLVKMKGRVTSPLCNAFSGSGHFAFHNFEHHQRLRAHQGRRQPLQGHNRMDQQRSNLIRLNNYRI